LRISSVNCKEFKKFTMRAEKTDTSFSANIYLAAIIIALQ